MAATNLKLEYLADKYMKKASEENSDALLEELVAIILRNEDIIIDGEKLSDGQVNPAHIQVTIDHRYYFHVYTSMIAFNKCQGKHAYILPLKNLLDSIYNNSDFGGITLNYQKNENTVLVSKEEIMNAMQKWLKDHTVKKDS